MLELPHNCKSTCQILILTYGEVSTVELHSSTSEGFHQEQESTDDESSHPHYTSLLFSILYFHPQWEKAWRYRLSWTPILLESMWPFPVQQLLLLCGELYRKEMSHWYSVNFHHLILLQIKWQIGTCNKDLQLVNKAEYKHCYVSNLAVPLMEKHFCLWPPFCLLCCFWGSTDLQKQTFQGTEQVWEAMKSMDNATLLFSSFLIVASGFLPYCGKQAVCNLKMSLMITFKVYFFHTIKMCGCLSYLNFKIVKIYYSVHTKLF